MNPSFQTKLQSVKSQIRSWTEKILGQPGISASNWLIGSGILLLLLGLWIFRGPGKGPSLFAQKEVLGWAEPLSGTSYVLEKGQMVRRKLETKTAIHHLESLETTDLSESVLDLNSGASIQINENSMVAIESVLESRGAYTLVTLLKGELRVLSSNLNNQTWISKNGKRILADEYEKSDLAQTALRPLKINPAIHGNETNEAERGSDSPPTELEISDALQRNRQSFFKCYAQLLQKDPEAKGELTLNFTLEPSGKVRSTEVSSQSLIEPSFQDCLTTVLKRIEFRSFTGAPVSTVFPMKFE